MPYAEVIFEPGSKSLMSYESDDELKSFLAEHDRRARNGEPGAPQDQVARTDIDPNDFANLPPLEVMKSRPAERVSKVILYDSNPIDYKQDDAVSADTIGSLVGGMTNESGQVSSHQLISALRDETSPVFPVDQGRHESMFKQDGTEMDLSFLDAPQSDSSEDGGSY